MNTLTLKDLPDELASSGNSLLSMIMQLSMSVGSRLPDCCSACTVSTISAPTPRRASGLLYTYLSMAVIIALPAFIFARVPNDTTKTS